MAPGIQGRVREHGNSGELDSVEYRPRIVAPAAPAPGNAMLVDVEFHPVQARIFPGPDGIIGTHHGTHGTADAGIFNPGVLTNTVKGIIRITVFGIFAHRRFDDPFLKRMQGDGLDRTHGRTLTAQGTSVIIIFDLPGQIIQT
jgi:hypothetical protein